MLTGFSRFLTKFFFEILPATAASAVAGYLLTQFGFSSQSTTATAPQASAVSPASPEALKMVKDGQETVIGALRGTSESTPRPVPAVREAEATRANQEAAARLKQEEQAAAQAIRQAKEAEAQAVRQAKEAEAKAAAAAKKLAARSAPPAQPKVIAPAEAPLGQLVVNRPVVAPTPAPIPAPTPVIAATPAPLPAPPTVLVPPAPQIAAAPAPEPLPAAPREKASSSHSWFSGGPPPRPPGTLPENLTNTSDAASPGGS